MNSYNATMASRRLKDKQPATDTPKQPVKQERASCVEIANRFTTLGTTPNKTTLLC